jgi:hypothetical protein
MATKSVSASILGSLFLVANLAAVQVPPQTQPPRPQTPPSGRPTVPPSEPLKPQGDDSAREEKAVELTLRGCLRKAESGFRLEGATTEAERDAGATPGQAYRLTPHLSTVQFDGYIGHTVEVKGRVEPAAPPAAADQASKSAPSTMPSPPATAAPAKSAEDAAKTPPLLHVSSVKSVESSCAPAKS